ncbi:MAG TPA: hypothetical protein VG734_17965 [Lacunisphaera sp.]|nr:hypothetical protein [Lacunisphaera sp.]
MNVTTRQELLQAIATEYIAKHGPADRRTIAAWAFRNKRIIPDETDIIDAIGAEMGQAMCAEVHTDPQGRKVRSKYAVRRKVKNQWGVWTQTFLWETHETIDEESMHLHFAQRRRQLVGHCQQFKNDADSYNENRNPAMPVQYDFNFNADLEEAAGDATHPDFPSDDDSEDEPI